MNATTPHIFLNERQFLIVRKRSMHCRPFSTPIMPVQTLGHCDYQTTTLQISKYSLKVLKFPGEDSFPSSSHTSNSNRSTLVLSFKYILNLFLIPSGEPMLGYSSVLAYSVQQLHNQYLFFKSFYSF